MSWGWVVATLFALALFAGANTQPPAAVAPTTPASTTPVCAQVAPGDTTGVKGRIRAVAVPGYEPPCWAANP